MTYVFIDLNGKTYLVGQLWSDFNTVVERSTFKYSDEWLNSKHRFAIEPALPLTAAYIQCKPNLRLFSGFTDSAQDAWCRKLIQHQAGARKLYEINYLLGVADFSRFGALRYKRDLTQPFLAIDNAESIPPVYKLDEFLTASKNELKLLIDPEQELTTFRPKASILDAKGHLFIAKFSQQGDQYSVILWEAVVLTIAAKANILVPKLQVHNIHNNNVLILSRFDRHGNKRIHYISGIGMLNSRDDEQHSYLELARAIKQYCVNPAVDLQALWRRIIFNILISNFDDHLRNHGFLYNKGWALAPLFDATPVPMHASFRNLYTKIDLAHKHATLDLALSVANQFALDQTQAKAIISEVAAATQQWRKLAKKFKIEAAEIDQLAQAFEHSEVEQAKRYSQ